MSISKEIQIKIKQSLPTAQVWVTDPMQDGAHLEAIVVSDEFEGMSLLQQQRLVLKHLKTSFDTNLHALHLKTFTPQSWETYQENNSQ